MIYLIKAYSDFGPLLKIGYSRDLSRRMNEYLTSTPRFKLLDVRFGTEEFEGKFHKYFSRYRFPQGNEWFYYNELIIKEFKTIRESDLLSKKSVVSKLSPFLNISDLLANRLDEISRKFCKNESGLSSYKSRIFNTWKVNSALEFPDCCGDLVDISRLHLQIGNSVCTSVSNFFPYFKNHTSNDIPLVLCNTKPEPSYYEEVETYALDVLEQYYVDKLQRFSLTKKPSLNNAMVDKFLEEYDKLDTIYWKLKYLCQEYVKFNEVDKEVLINNIHEKRFREYIIILGPDVCRACGYATNLLNDKLDVTSFDYSKLTEAIYSNFSVNESYSSAHIKNRLGELYKELDYKSTPKAKDLEQYFEMKPCKVRVDKIRVNGFKILAKKE
jgi:hypothetical protein